MASEVDINKFLDAVNYRIGDGNFFPKPTYVSAFMLERYYGGPEEGGWWYDTQTPLASIRCSNRGEALKAYEFLVKYFDEDIVPAITRFSVLNGWDFAIWLTDDIAEYEPKEVPRYE